MSAIKQLPQFIQSAKPAITRRLDDQLTALLTPFEELDLRMKAILHGAINEQIQSADINQMRLGVFGLSPELTTDPEQLVGLMSFFPSYTQARGTRAGLLLLLRNWLPGFQFVMEERTFPRQAFRVGQVRLGHNGRALQCEDTESRSVVILINGETADLAPIERERLHRLLRVEIPLGHQVFLVFREAESFPTPQVPVWQTLGERL